MPDSILVVDDDEFSREYLRLLLEAGGYVVREAAGGDTALEMLRSGPVALVLLDIVMPGRDGLDICMEIKADPALVDIPVIFLSSRSDVQDKIAGLEAGGADYVSKPFDAGEVLARVRAHMKLQSLTSELRRANQELSRRQELIDQDLMAAGRIQQSLLPKGNPAPARVDIAWKFRPSQRVGGDIFNVAALGPDHLCFYTLDVSGHGVHSALVAVSAFQSLLPQGGNVLVPGSAALPVPAGEVLAKLDEQFPLDRYEQYFTIFYMVLDLATGEARYSSAGHPPGVLLRASGEMELLEEGGSFVGLGGIVPFEEGSCRLNPGDSVIMYTDGLTEYENGSGEFYGTQRFYDSLRALAGKPPGELVEHAWQSAFDFGEGREPLDDISLLGFTLLKA
jgi:sigma-B regulation protein RsbU (phosphoserine phosphatase)